MRYCGLDSKKINCLCITCFNDTCIAYYGKVCMLCFYKSAEDIYTIRGHSCMSYYSWTDRLKKKKFHTMINSMDKNYIRIQQR